ncbi:flagellar protein FlaG [Thermaerobacter sp. FW80]|uniref:flagellar protein FlaG n=1 Tax=Thermaerobacter sp. FW80 TaxID=2546351 RepID=UPI001074E0E6|nr:flagellar protein FlaG [Thermaerobacter sp. FW80]QBS37218.1 flagellar protein FlaG [Thermaerobacter sp. FW80]
MATIPGNALRLPGGAGGGNRASGSGGAPAELGPTPAARPAGIDPWMPPLQDLPSQAFAYRLEFHVDDATGRLVAQVVDRETGETVRQVPPEHVLRIAMYLECLMGRLLDHRW